MSDGKFSIENNTLIVAGPFELAGVQQEEMAFLEAVDRLVGGSHENLVIDLTRAGSLSSTVYALVIAAQRKAAEHNRKLSVRVHRRNSKTVRVAGIEGIINFHFV